MTMIKQGSHSHQYHHVDTVFMTTTSTTTHDDSSSIRDDESKSRSSSSSSSSRMHTMMREIIDFSLCLRTAGVDFIILIYRNKYDIIDDNNNHHDHNNDDDDEGRENVVDDLLLVSDVKYLESQLHRYIDLLLIHDDNTNKSKNINEANCEVNRYHHHYQLSSSGSEKGAERRGLTNETVESVSASDDDDDDDNDNNNDDDDDDIGSRGTMKRMLPVVALSGKEKIEVISIFRRNMSSSVSTKRISFET